MKKKGKETDPARRDAMMVAVENLLQCFTDDEALAVLGAVHLAGAYAPDGTEGQEPSPVDQLAKDVLLSRWLTLRCVRAFLEMGRLEGLKMIAAPKS